MTIDVSNNDSNEQDVQQAKENKHTLHVLRKCVTVLRAHEVEFFTPLRMLGGTSYTQQHIVFGAIPNRN